jgi:D-glycero-D-manno-heptose 1,7-bisphosphate phosphatase
MKTVFLDRDGVICYNRPDHVKSWAEFCFLPGALDGLRALTQAGCRIVVVTNQAVISRGQLTAAQVDEIHARMIAAVAAAGGRIDKVLYCPHRPDEDCACRKPRPGLLWAAAREYPVDWSQAYLVGDHWTDIQAGLSAGCRTALVLTGRGLRAVFATETRKQRGYLVSRSLKHSVKHILGDADQWPYGIAQRAWGEMRGLARQSLALSRPAAGADRARGDEPG